jgi:hypothetical protein
VKDEAALNQHETIGVVSSRKARWKEAVDFKTSEGSHFTPLKGIVEAS